MKEFIDGRNGNKSQQEEAEIKQVNDFIGPNYSFMQFSRQKCRDLYIQISYQVCCFTSSFDNKILMGLDFSSKISSNWYFLDFIFIDFQTGSQNLSIILEIDKTKFIKKCKVWLFCKFKYSLYALLNFRGSKSNGKISHNGKMKEILVLLDYPMILEHVVILCPTCIQWKPRIGP